MIGRRVGTPARRPAGFDPKAVFRPHRLPSGSGYVLLLKMHTSGTLSFNEGKVFSDHSRATDGNERQTKTGVICRGLGIVTAGRRGVWRARLDADTASTRVGR